MADAGLLIGWKQAKAGREAQAMELFGSTMSYYQQEVEQGNIESFEPVLVQAHGGDLNGFILIRGSREQCDALRNSDEFRGILVRAIYCLDGVGVINTYLGDGLQQMMSEWGMVVSQGR